MDGGSNVKEDRAYNTRCKAAGTAKDCRVYDDDGVEFGWPDSRYSWARLEISNILMCALFLRSFTVTARDGNICQSPPDGISIFESNTRNH